MGNLLMITTVLISAGRNILSKDIGKSVHGKYDFFLSQTLLFSCGMAVIFLLNPMKILSLSFGVLPYALIYGIFLVSSQWLYTFSLKNGSVGVCSLVYSFGFIIPAVSGALVWGEPFGAVKCVGIVLVIISILLSVKTDGSSDNKRYLIPLIIAMLSSGGLGIMQKVQQKSEFKQCTAEFLFFAFLFAFLVSLTACGFTKSRIKSDRNTKFKVISASAGLCFGGANYINTILAGMIESMVFFPLQNIATVSLTAVLGAVIFKEKPTPKKVLGFAVGIAAIFILKL